MAILVVGGSHRGVGKTALVCGLMGALPEYKWIAIKITSHDHGLPATVWEEMQAGQGTDTARYMSAGAMRAFLITASDGEIKERLAELERMVGPDDSVIYESNRVVDFIKPDLFLLVDDPGAEQAAKLSFMRVASVADAMVSQGSSDSESAERECSGSDAGRPRFQLVAFEGISPQMLEWLRERIPDLRKPGKRNSGLRHGA
jgi:hypothetical protein